MRPIYCQSATFEELFYSHLLETDGFCLNLNILNPIKGFAELYLSLKRGWFWILLPKNGPLNALWSSNECDGNEWEVCLLLFYFLAFLFPPTIGYCLSKALALTDRSSSILGKGPTRGKIRIIKASDNHLSFLICVASLRLTRLNFKFSSTQKWSYYFFDFRPNR